MNNKAKLASLMVLVCALGAGAYFIQDHDGGADEGKGLAVDHSPDRAHSSPNPPSLQESAKTPSQVTASVALAYAVLNRGSSMKLTLDQIVGPSGSITSPELASLVGTADATCADLRTEPDHYLGDGNLNDPTRAWASKRLVEICHDFDIADYTFDFPKNGLSKDISLKTDSQLIDASLLAIRSEKSASELYTAGQILLEKDRSKLLAVLPREGQGYGDPEILRSWALASTLVTCDEAGGCGPNSLQTASFCVNAGCEFGRDFPQALKQRLPESDYRAVNAFYNWMTSQRRT